MLKELKFVQGAVARKEFIPTLTHVRIENATVRSFNGTLALCSPIDFDIDCTPKATPFIKAIGNCAETVSLAMTPAGRLKISSGPFKAFIECVDQETPHVVPEGDIVNIEGEQLLEALKAVLPFVGDDASRPWANGILLDNHSAFATNNVMLVEYWIGSQFPIKANIPSLAVREMVRVNEAPEYIRMQDNCMSFHYSDGRWIRTSLLATDWPALHNILDVPSTPDPIDEQLWDALIAIKPFVDKLERVYIRDGVVATSILEEEGASYQIPGFPHTGVYQLQMLNLLKDVATKMDFSTYPKPCLFFGPRLRGAMIGMR